MNIIKEFFFYIYYWFLLLIFIFNILSICYSGGFENLSRRATPDKLLCDKAFSIAKKPNYNGYRHGLTSRVYKFFEEKSIAMGEIKHLVFLLMQGQKLTN